MCWEVHPPPNPAERGGGCGCGHYGIKVFNLLHKDWASFSSFLSRMRICWKGSVCFFIYLEVPLINYSITLASSATTNLISTWHVPYTYQAAGLRSWYCCNYKRLNAEQHSHGLITRQIETTFASAACRWNSSQ